MRKSAFVQSENLLASLSPNYHNEYAIRKAQKRYDKEVNRRNPDPLKIAMAQNALGVELLFEKSYVLPEDYEHCFVFSNKSGAVRMAGVFVWYAEIALCRIVESYAERAHTTTTTRKKGGITRAVVGGALFGGVGAVVGAATAGSRGESNTTYHRELDGFVLRVYDRNGAYLAGVKLPGDGFFRDKEPKLLSQAAFIFDAIIAENQYRGLL